jgi:hypothetical protein
VTAQLVAGLVIGGKPKRPKDALDQSRSEFIARSSSVADARKALGVAH